MAKDYLGLEERRGYQRPASALTGQEMAILADWREKTDLPICQLLRQAVVEIDNIIKKGGNNGGKMGSDKTIAVA